jgi:hypothetical protein
MRAKRTIAVLIVAGIPTLLMIWYRVRHVTEFASVELISFPLFFGGLSIGVVYVLKRYFLPNTPNLARFWNVASASTSLVSRTTASMTG